MNLNDDRNKLLSQIIIGFIFLLSFRYYSANFYPALNSDNAITVLMIHYFQLPHDFYFWGQDRMGSLIPLLGQIPFKIFGLSELMSESLVHYLILLAGYLAFASFLKANFLKIIFSIIWFFPPKQLLDVTQFAYGIDYSLIAISCYLLNTIFFKTNGYSRRIMHLRLMISILLLLVAVWVLDLAIFTIVIIISGILYKLLFEKKINSTISKSVFLTYIPFGAIIGIVAISYIKGLANFHGEYSVLADKNTVLTTVTYFFQTVLGFLLFRTSDFFTSIWSYLAILLGCLIVYASIGKFNIKDIKSFWIIVFLLDCIVLFSLFMLTEWTAINNVPRRYFTCTYISLSFSLIMLFDSIGYNSLFTRSINVLLLITVLVGGSGSMYSHYNVWPKTLKPKAEVVGEFKSLGKIGIIGDFWNSYLISCVDPENIKAVPAEYLGGRNDELINYVFDQPRIFAVRDMWMESFPDSLFQYQRKLIKTGNEFFLGNCFVCEYKLVTKT